MQGGLARSEFESVRVMTHIKAECTSTHSADDVIQAFSVPLAALTGSAIIRAGIADRAEVRQ